MDDVVSLHCTQRRYVLWRRPLLSAGGNVGATVLKVGQDSASETVLTVRITGFSLILSNAWEAMFPQLL